MSEQAQETRRIVRDSLAVSVATGAYGVSFGAIGVTSGLDVLQTCALSLLVFTGASQFAFVGVVGAGGAPLLGAASGLLLGVRNALYGLRLGPLLGWRGARRAAAAHLVIDESTAMSVTRDSRAAARVGFLTTGVGVFVLWNLATLVGALAGNALGDPRAYGLDAVRFGVAAKTSDLPAIAIASGAAASVRTWLPLVVAFALGFFVFANRDFRASPELIVGGIVIGAVIVAGWYVSAHLGYLAEDPDTLQEKFVATNSGRAESFSFVSPIAYLLELLLLWTDASRVVTFGIAGVLGMVAGSAAMALSMRTFRWEGFGSVEDISNHVVGGVLMGFGGVTALGCTIGQGLSGVSTLAVGSIIALVSIIAGCLAAVRYQGWRIERLDARASDRGAQPSASAEPVM